ncbi:MAG: Arm DNA-binding domain-containing protein [Novosphingobium sp.]
MLTEVACRSAVPREREYKLSDVGGLSLRIRPTGLKTWCWKYSYAGREKRLTIGRYPEVSLKQARLARDKARGALAEGIDPGHEKKLSKIVIAAEALNTFEDIARA